MLLSSQTQQEEIQAETHEHDQQEDLQLKTQNKTSYY